MTNIFRYCGFGKETVFGTAVDATFHLDQTGLTLDNPGTPEIIVPSGLGRAPRVKVPGFYAPAGTVDYAWDIETITYFLRWVLPGGYMFTSGTPGTHEFWGADSLTPQSFTVRSGKDIFEHVFAGAILNTLTLAVDNQFGTCSLGIMAQKDSKATLKTYGDLTLPVDPPTTWADVSAEVNNEDYNAIVKGFSLTMNNNTNAETGRTVGSRFPSSYQFGGRDVTLTLTLLFPDTEMLTLFWGDAAGITDCGSTLLPVELAINPPACPTETRSLTILLPNMVMEQPQQQPRGRDQLLQTINLRAMIGEDVALKDASTVDTDILCTLKNNTSTQA